MKGKGPVLRSEGPATATQSSGPTALGFVNSKLEELGCSGGVSLLVGEGGKGSNVWTVEKEC